MKHNFNSVNREFKKCFSNPCSYKTNVKAEIKFVNMK